MDPTFAGDDAVNSPTAETKLNRKSALIDAAAVTFADPLGYLKGELGLRVFGSAHRGAWSGVVRTPLRVGVHSVASSTRRTSFLGHITAIVGIGPQPQMGRVDASAIIPTGAIVQHLQTIRDWSVRHLPGDTMGKRCLTCNLDVSISACVQTSGPQPALARLVHLRPETISQWGGASLRRHLLNLLYQFGVPMRQTKYTTYIAIARP